MMLNPELSLEKGNSESEAQRDNRRLRHLEQEQAAIKAEFSRTIQEIKAGMDAAMAQAPQQKPIQEFGSARSELSGLGYTLIPVESLRAIGKIFQEGQAKYKSGAVNARRLTPVLGNHSWQYERAEHAMDHLLKFFSGDESEDHLAKVAWFCTIMREIVRKEKEKGLPHAFSASNV